MTTTTKLVATVLFAGGLLATTGFGLTQGSGDGPPAPAAKVAPAAKPEAAKVPAKAGAGVPPVAEPISTQATAPKIPRAETDVLVRERLQLAAGVLPEKMMVGELIKLFDQEFGLRVRFDTPSYIRLSGYETGEWLKTVHERRLGFRSTAGMKVADVLTDALAQMGSGSSYRIRGGSVLIVPAYEPPASAVRVANPTQEQAIEVRRQVEQKLGDPVSVAFEKRPLEEVLKELRSLTGANIVVHYSQTSGPNSPKSPITATFDDARLYTALLIVADLGYLQLVYLDNVYYLTSPDKAEQLKKRVREDLYGVDPKPPLVVPTGYVTDGVSFFLKPADLKPVTPSADGSLPPVTAAKK